MNPRALVGSAVVVASLLGCGGGGGGSSTPTGSTAGRSPDAVTIQNFAFAPPNLTIATETTVTWSNADQSTHTVTADDKSFDAGNLAPGNSFSFRFQRAGTYAYHCNIHQYMRAVITVTG
jgi:plastocyanin